MEWNEIKSEICDTALAVLEPMGYRLIESREMIERRAGGDARFVVPQFTAKKDSFREAHPWCGIRIGEIETIFHRTSGVAEKFRRQYCVINCGMSEPLDLGDRSAVDEAKVKMEEWLKTSAVPLLEKPHSIEDFSTLLNADPTSPSSYHANEENRCHYGLICARLAGDPEYESIKAAYTSHLRRIANGFYYPRFQDLVADLEAEGF